MERERTLTIYEEIKKVLKPEDIDNYYGDLYCKITPESKRIVDNYKYKNNVEIFRCEIDGLLSLWYDIPFAYDPYYESMKK